MMFYLTTFYLLFGLLYTVVPIGQVSLEIRFYLKNGKILRKNLEKKNRNILYCPTVWKLRCPKLKNANSGREQKRVRDHVQ